jgi:hypothetical protein
MKPRTFLFLHLACAALGAVVLWWFVFRDRSAEANADTMTAAAVAG